MNSFQLENIIKSTPRLRNIAEVLPWNYLPKTKPKTRRIYIVNTLHSERSTSNQLGHWFLLLSASGTGDNIQFCSFSQDYDDILPGYFKDNLTVNIFQLQSFNTVVCGQFCVYIAWHLAAKKNRRTYDSILGDFTVNNTLSNDLKVFNFVKDKFGVVTDLFLEIK